MFAQSLGAAHTLPHATLNPGRPPLCILGPVPHPWLSSHPPWLPALHPHGWALSHILLCLQLHTKGLCARPSPRSRPLPRRHTKALPVPRPAPAQAQGLARVAWGNLPHSLPSSPSAGGVPRPSEERRGPQRHPLSTAVCCPPTAGEASHSRDPHPPLLTFHFVCAAGLGGKKGGEKNKNQLLPFNI